MGRLRQPLSQVGGASGLSPQPQKEQLGCDTSACPSQHKRCPLSCAPWHQGYCRPCTQLMSAASIDEREVGEVAGAGRDRVALEISCPVAPLRSGE